MLLKSAAIVAKKVGCQLNAESRSGPGPGPESVSIFFFKRCCFRVRVIGQLCLSGPGHSIRTIKVPGSQCKYFAQGLAEYFLVKLHLKGTVTPRSTWLY